MTPTTVPPRPGRDPAELDVLAEVAGRMLTAAAQLTSHDPHRRPGDLSLILADAQLLARMLGDSWDAPSASSSSTGWSGGNRRCRSRSGWSVTSSATSTICHGGWMR